MNTGKTQLDHNPPKSKPEAETMMSVAVPLSLKEAVHKMARLLDLSASEVMRRGIAAYVDHEYGQEDE